MQPPDHNIHSNSAAAQSGSTSYRQRSPTVQLVLSSDAETGIVTASRPSKVYRRFNLLVNLLVDRPAKFSAIIPIFMV